MHHWLAWAQDPDALTYPKINTEPSSSLVYEFGDKLTAMHQC